MNVATPERARPGAAPVPATVPAANVASTAAVVDGGRRVAFTIGEVDVELHPLWLLERSVEPGAIDPTNRQRLYEPDDVPADLTVAAAAVAGDQLDVTFSDGRRSVVPVGRVLVELGVLADPEDPPAPVPWRGAVDRFPTIEWARIADDEAVLDVLGGFFRYGFFLVRGAPTVPGSLHSIAAAFGRISPTNWGELFDVVSVPRATDLAYTPVGLSAHTDGPYRRPNPGIQFLHALVNDAGGGDSTVVDGLAAVEALRAADPEAFEVLSTVAVEYRHAEVLVNRVPMIELHSDGTLRHFRFSARLDFAPALDAAVLDVYYRGRRWLAEFLNDPANVIGFRLEAGDAIVVDNGRVLHGRTPFDPSIGHRHLQGCYIDHDGPDTMWRLAAQRRIAAAQAAGRPA